MSTRAIRPGALPTGIDSRSPAIVAKTVTTLDVLSHGRDLLTLGVDTGHGSEIERLRERLQICRSVLQDDAPTFSGTHYSMAGAVNRPRPLRAGESNSGVRGTRDFVTKRSVEGRCHRRRRGGHHRRPHDVQDAVDQVRGATRYEEGRSNPIQVIWLGSPSAGVTSHPAVTDLVAECRARFAAGADGCIPVMNGNSATDQFRQMERLGRELAR